MAGPALPPLREELQISQGAPLLSGAPTWVIYDPIRHKFFQIGQRTTEILSRWRVGSAAALRERVFKDRALQVTDDELERLVGFLRQHNLLAPETSGTASQLHASETRARELTPLRALQKSIFIRVPLVRPQAFLEATLPLVRPLMTAAFLWITAIFLVFGLYLAGRLYPEVLDHLRAAFSATGLLTYAFAIVFLKALHELGHAYQAVHRGLRVPVIGVALIAMFPLLYTDVSDSWRLRARRDKIMIDAAGVMTEMVVAVYATLLWCFLPDGALRSATFAVATTGWVLSLLVNLNPLMRFDGYYLLADVLGIQNLQTRATAMGKWALRRLLFGLRRPSPEALTNGMARFIVSYAFAMWLYRLFLFLSIGLLLYTLLFKALGIVFLVGTLLAFVVKPIVAEIAEWVGMRREIAGQPRTWVSLVVLLAGLGALFWPVSTRITMPAVLEYEAQHLIFPPARAQLEEVLVAEGARVAEGDVLMRFSDPELPIAIEKSEVRMEMYARRLLSGVGDVSELGARRTLERLQDEERETLSALRDREDDLILRAAGPGVVRDLATDLHPEAWTDRTQLLGRIVDPGALTVQGLIREGDRNRLDPASEVTFIAEDPLFPSVELVAVTLSDFAAEHLPDAYLAQVGGGPVGVVQGGSSRGDPNALVPADVWYPVTAKVPFEAAAGLPPTQVAQRGVIHAKSQPESWAARIWRRVAQVLIRESGF